MHDMHSKRYKPCDLSPFPSYGPTPFASRRLPLCRLLASSLAIEG